jgi:hypothetical protein
MRVSERLTRGLKILVSVVRFRPGHQEQIKRHLRVAFLFLVSGILWPGGRPLLHNYLTFPRRIVVLFAFKFHIESETVMTYRALMGKVWRCVAASAAVVLACGHANAVPITYTTSGIILSGIDSRGTFSQGVASRDLSGLTFSQSVTFDPTLVTNETSEVDYTSIYGRLYSSTATTTVTIDNVSNSFSWDASKFILAQVALMNWLTQGGSPFDGVVFRTFGLTDNDTNVDVGSNVYSRVNAFQLGLNLEQNWSYVVKPDDFVQDAAFSVWGTDAEANYLGRPDTISMQIATTVPEPSSVILIALGFTLLFAARRKVVRQNED